MSAHTGTPMQLQIVRTRFEQKSKPGRLAGTSCLSERIVEIRKLLRTDQSIAQIAQKLGCERQTLRTFIRRRAICDMKARTNFITLQRSIAREEARVAQMESSRIVGGSAQSQDLPRAPNSSSSQEEAVAIAPASSHPIAAAAIHGEAQC